MHIIGLIIAVLSGLAVWYWRLRMLRRLGSNVIDAAGKFRGRQRRAKTARATQNSPIEAISDPVTAAATLIRLLVGESTWPGARGRVQARLAELSSYKLAQEAVTYADWAGQQGTDRRRGVQSLTRRLRDWLTLQEREDLVSVINDAAASGTPGVQAKASREALALIN